MTRYSWFSQLACLSFFIAILGVTSAKAEPTPPTPECFRKAVAIHKLPMVIVLALMKTEGGHSGHVSRNTNGSYDLGVMQINDRTWIREIANRDFNGDVRQAWETVRDNGCYNLMWGTEIFSRYVDEAQGKYWLAVGYYNSHTLEHRLNYTKHVITHFVEVLRVMQKYGALDEARTQMTALNNNRG